jgi:hypothetical protein
MLNLERNLLKLKPKIRVWTWNWFAILEPVPPIFLMIQFNPVSYYQNRFAFKAGAQIGLILKKFFYA